jgi:hypothetical protein
MGPADWLRILPQRFIPLELPCFGPGNQRLQIGISACERIAGGVEINVWSSDRVPGPPRLSFVRMAENGDPKFPET